MNFGDQNLSSNPEILSFAKHHFTIRKKGLLTLPIPQGF